jgi:hypothetical protein
MSTTSEGVKIKITHRKIIREIYEDTRVIHDCFNPELIQYGIIRCENHPHCKAIECPAMKDKQYNFLAMLEKIHHGKNLNEK